MQTFDQALFDLVVANRISVDEALRHADSMNDLRLAIKLHRQTGASTRQDKNINDLEIL
jgi:twitching motility protein PilU